MKFFFTKKKLTLIFIGSLRGQAILESSSVTSMDLLYPKIHSKIYLPVQLDGQSGSTVFEATHRNSAAVVYWHLDGAFIGRTLKAHHFSLRPHQGKHLLILVDDAGETLQRQFEIISVR